MWIAQTISGVTITAREAKPGELYFCPNKESVPHELILRQSADGRPHFAHRPLSSCPWSKSEETIRKGILKKLRLELANFQVMAGGKSTLRVNSSFVIQVVTSDLYEEHWKALTKRHNDIGHPVLWIFDSALTGHLTFKELEENQFVVLPPTLRLCQYLSYNRLYLFDRNYELRAYRFFKVKDRKGLYVFGSSSPLHFQKPRLSHLQWKEGYEVPLSEPLWHLYPKAKLIPHLVAEPEE